MMEVDFLLVFVAGLLGGAGHCVGMCGPIVASWALRGVGSNLDRRGALLRNALYNCGRVTTYAFVGGVMGAGGSFVKTVRSMAHAQNWVAIVAGIFMILLGLDVAGAFGWAKKIESPKPFLKAAGFVMESDSPSRFYPLGLLMGLMPCGMSYTVFISSAGSGSLLKGMLLALAFGLGTVPAMFLFGVLVGEAGAKLRGWLYRSGGVVIAVMGAIYLYRGISSNAGM